MTAMTRTDTSQAEAFLEAAYARLIEGGVDAVKVAPLAEALTLTRTAFYWHFKDRESLLEALLARWEAKNTGNLIAQAEAFRSGRLGVMDFYRMENVQADTQMRSSIAHPEGKK